MGSKIAGDPAGKHVARDPHGRFAPKVAAPPPVGEPPAQPPPPPEWETLTAADGEVSIRRRVRRLMTASLGDLFRGPR